MDTSLYFLFTYIYLIQFPFPSLSLNGLFRSFSITNHSSSSYCYFLISSAVVHFFYPCCMAWLLELQNIIVMLHLNWTESEIQYFTRTIWLKSFLLSTCRISCASIFIPGYRYVVIYYFIYSKTICWTSVFYMWWIPRSIAHWVFKDSLTSIHSVFAYL